jgi:branched-chain amino acid transport system permease protein
MSSVGRNGIAILVFAAAMAPLPLVLQSDYLLNFAIMALFYAFLGQAWNVLGGYGGQFSFGHAAFFGTGAYCATILQVSLGVNPWIGFALGIAAGAVIGAVVGYLSFRYGLRGSYFALVTLAFAEVLRILSNSVDFTGAGVGILIPLDPGVASMQFESKGSFFLLMLALVVAGLAVTWWLERSRFGARLMAVRENEDAARALGVDVFRTKLAAITLSGAMAGAAGCFYAQYFLYLDPHIAYGPAVSVEALLVPIIGGIGTVFGPLVGSGVLHLASELTRSLFGAVPGVNLILYGALLVVMILFLPNGLIGLGKVSARRLIGRRA